MKAAEGELYIEKGTDWSQNVWFRQSDGHLLDISSWRNFECQIRKNATDPYIQAKPVFKIIDNPDKNEGGKIGEFSLTVAETSAIETNGVTYKSVANYVFDLYAVDSLGKRFRVLNGPAKISPEVTR